MRRDSLGRLRPEGELGPRKPYRSGDYEPYGCPYAVARGEGFSGAVETARVCVLVRAWLSGPEWCEIHGPLSVLDGRSEEGRARARAAREALEAMAS